jgi:hypothetical protein
MNKGTKIPYLKNALRRGVPTDKREKPTLWERSNPAKSAENAQCGITARKYAKKLVRRGQGRGRGDMDPLCGLLQTSRFGLTRG